MDELLRLLKANALESPANLAKMLGQPEDEVRNRMRGYEQTGVIRGYQAVLNEDRLNLDQVQAVIEVRITPEREGGFDRIAGRVAKFDEVESLFLMSGAYDLLVLVKGESLRKVAGFVSEKLATIEGVLSTATHFVLKTYKRQGVLMHTESGDERMQVSP